MIAFRGGNDRVPPRKLAGVNWGARIVCRIASIKHELLRIGRECAALPVLDARPPDEILGYDEAGLPR